LGLGDPAGHDCRVAARVERSSVLGEPAVALRELCRDLVVAGVRRVEGRCGEFLDRGGQAVGRELPRESWFGTR